MYIESGSIILAFDISTTSIIEISASILAFCLLFGLGGWLANKMKSRPPTPERLAELDERLLSREEFTRLASTSQMILAINLYRAETGASLSEAAYIARQKHDEIQHSLLHDDSQHNGDTEENDETVGRWTASGLDIETDHKVMDQLSRGNKIAAIKIFRGFTGCSLREAKAAIDALERDQPFMPRGHRPINYAEDPDLHNQLIALLHEGRTLQAIKIYREYTGCDLRTAKRAVETLALTTNQPAELDSVTRSTILELLQQNRKIEAIKIYREHISCDLRTAKEAVEAMADAHLLK